MINTIVTFFTCMCVYVYVCVAYVCKVMYVPVICISTAWIKRFMLVRRCAGREINARHRGPASPGDARGRLMWRRASAPRINPPSRYSRRFRLRHRTATSAAIAVQTTALPASPQATCSPPVLANAATTAGRRRGFADCSCPRQPQLTSILPSAANAACRRC